jgi:DNA-binding transcriptional regulator YiaG
MTWRVEFAPQVQQDVAEAADWYESRQPGHTNLMLPTAVEAIDPKEISGIRRRLNVSQPVFAALLNVPLATARSWEQGKRRPSGAALRLLDLARQRPEILLAA